VSSIILFRELLKTVSPKLQVFNVLLVAVVLLASAALYYSTLRTYTLPVLTHLLFVEGRIHGEGQIWAYDRTVVQFGVAYSVQEKKYIQPVYADLSVYQQSGLKIGTRVYLAVEPLGQGSEVRELTTQEGRVVFDDELNRQVIERNNESVWRSIGLLVLMALVPFFVALRIAWKSRGTLFQSCRLAD